MDGLTTRLSDVLRLLALARGQHSKAERIKKAAEAYYADPLLAAVQLGQYLVGNGFITTEELQEGLDARGVEIDRYRAASPEERTATVMRVLDNAECAITNAKAVLSHNAGSGPADPSPPGGTSTADKAVQARLPAPTKEKP
jgi:hypothetical protein